MNRNEALEILAKVSVHCQYFKADEERESAWYKVLHNFKYEDAENNLEILLRDEKFRANPSVYEIIKGLTPIYEKVSFENRVVFCQICKRPLNQNEEQKHLDRCRSVRYITSQTKKWSGKEFNKRELYEMSDEEFNKKYDEILHYVYNHTTDKHEKMRIGFIFNTPNKEVAKKFLGGKSEKNF